MLARTFPVLIGLLLAAGAAWGQPTWEEPTGFSGSMTVIAVLDLDGTASEDTNDLVAAFVDGAVRGVASPQNLGGTYVYFLSVAGDADGEKVTFRAYDASADQERALCERLAFRADATRGSLGDPMGLFAADGASDGTCPLHWTAVTGYTDLMTVNASLFILGTRTNDPDDRLVAVVDEEIRGVGVPFDASGDQVYFLEVAGDVAGESFTFWAYDASTGVAYLTDQALTFIDGDSEGTPASPFAVTTGEVLPVELVAFEARIDGGAVVLSWETASETNNAGFEVQQAAPPGHAWQAAGFVDGAGTTNEARSYHHRVEGLAPGTYRFRLRQVDYDGAFSYSQEAVVTLQGGGALALTAPYPQPAHGTAFITLSVAREQDVEVALYDVLGRRVAVLFEGRLAAQAAQALRLDTGRFTPGLYHLRATGETFTATRPLVVSY